ncbi:MAG: dihydrofolate reductase [Actinobacteria bacterium]|uniref:Dihydrofolate reductase n=1 Tax=Candidatus Fonsibacter lacus TaxID=2576439 RepID=A0A965GDD5_9PROT|nr:dihydrofolate reductase [Candidatus Fonsibacter lacus]
MKHVVWAQWDDLVVPEDFTLRSPANTDLATASADELSDITFYVPSYMGGRGALEFSKKMANLKVLQMPNAGYEDAIEFTRPGMTLCNGRGIHDASTAELAVGLAIASLRGFPEFVRHQDKGQWNHKRHQSINDKKVAIIGYGSIGKTVARNLSGFDVTVVPFSRSGSDGALKIADLDKHLPTFDVVILILPLNDESRKMFNKERLALLKDGALLVNVARGGIVDTDALVAELRSGRITAALDVTDPEPLPEGHPLWSAPGVLIAPHVGGNTSAFEPRARRLVESQLSRLAQGKALDNVIIAGEVS